MRDYKSFKLLLKVSILLIAVTLLLAIILCSNLLTKNAYAGIVRRVIKVKEPVKKEYLESLKLVGINIVRYIPHVGYIAEIDESEIENINKFDFIQDVGSINLDSKLSNELSLAVSNDLSGVIKLNIRINDLKEKTNVINFVETIDGVVVDDQDDKGISYIIIQIDVSKIEQLKGYNEIEYIERYKSPTIFNYESAQLIGAPYLWNYIEGIFFTGSNQIVDILDTGIDQSHLDFEGKFIIPPIDVSNDSDISDFEGHGTHVTGSVVGSGFASEGVYKGIAFNAQVVFQAMWDNINNTMYLPADISNLLEQASSYNANIHLISWGIPTNGNYTLLSQQVDEYLYQHPSDVIVCAVGNALEEASIASPATSKNAIAVGAYDGLLKKVANHSSKGPCIDSRLKPDLIAPGVGIISTAPGGSDYAIKSGTSGSSAFIAGLSVLIREYFVEKFNVNPSGSLIKATLINFADRIGVPVNEEGYGLPNVSELTNKNLEFVNEEKCLSTGDVITFHYNISGDESFSITLCWTDCPGNPSSESQLINDLDLVVTDPSGKVINGNHLFNLDSSQNDRINNVEKVKIDSPINGTYMVQIKGHNVPMGFQNFSLIASAEGIDKISEIFPEEGNGQIILDLTDINTESFPPLIWRVVKIDDSGQTVIYELLMESPPEEIISIDVPIGHYMVYVENLSTGEVFPYYKDSIEIQNRQQLPIIIFYGGASHRQITEEALKLLNQLDTQDIYEELYDVNLGFRDYVADGSVHEDNINHGGTLLRWLQHFYNPVGGGGYGGFQTATEWAVSSSNYYNWNNAISRYNYTDNSKQDAYYALGHVVHLLEDMGLPEHTQTGFVRGAHFYRDGYEQWMENNTGLITTLASQATTPKYYNNVVAFFDPLATISYYTNYFTFDWTGIISPTPDTSTEVYRMFPDVNYVYGGSGGILYWNIPEIGNYYPIATTGVTDGWWISDGSTDHYFLAFIEDATPEEYNGIPNTTNKVLPEYFAETLIPETIEFSAGLLKLYHDLVNHPPYVEKVIITQDSRTCYEAYWEDEISTNVVTNRKLMPEDPKDRNQSCIEKGNMVAVEINFSEKVKEVEVKYGSLLVTGSLNSDEYVWTGSFSMPNDGSLDGIQTLDIKAKDKNNHYGISTSGINLDSNPGSPAKRQTDYTWGTTYQSGHDRNHKIGCACIDLILVVDTTGSMWDDIAAAKASAIDIVNNLDSSGLDYRVAVVSYRDFPVWPYGSYSDWPYRAVLPFSTDKSSIIAAINSLYTGGGADWPESLYSALIRAMLCEGLGDWRNIPGIKKSVIFMTDAPPHDPEPFTGYTSADVTSTAFSVDPATLFPISIGYNSTTYSYLQILAEGTGGKIFTAANAGEVVSAIIEAIETTLNSPIADPGGPYTGTVGETITLDASASYDPDGTIVSYEWDFDNDGVYDESVTSAITTHTWSAEYIGLIRLRVTDNDGLSAVGVANIDIIGNQPPTADAGPDQTVAVDSDCMATVTLNGSASSDLDGDPLTYSWTLAGSSANGVNPTIRLPLGATTITLVVNDGTVDSAPDDVEITVIDDSPPMANVLIPASDDAVQDGITFRAEASDNCEIKGVYLTLREKDGPPIGYENVEAIFIADNGKWEYQLDTTQLDDGYYVITAKAEDASGNMGFSDTVMFSIRNWAVIELLPASQEYQAGRTMPIKFSLRIAETVDPNQPFVYNEELMVKILDSENNPLQESIYGDESTDYRIDQTEELYITNFKTSKTPAEYKVEIWRIRNDFLIGEFGFTTFD